MFDSMNSAAFDVLIKILKILLTSDPMSAIRARFYSSRAFQRAQKRPKQTKNEEDLKILKSVFSFWWWRRHGHRNPVGVPSGAPVHLVG